MASAEPVAPESPGRRRLLAGFVYAASGAIASALAALLGKFFAAPLFARSSAGTREVALGPVDRFRDAAEPVAAFYARQVPDGYLRRIEKGRVYVVAREGELLCLSTTCTHLGCSVHWDGKRRQFLCPCHGGVYAKDGTVIAGPPPQPLARLPFRIAGGQLVISPEDLG